MKKKIFTLLFALVGVLTAQAQENTINGHEYVDLGLPSGTLWATCNVGAEKPEGYGDYFAWGETQKKDVYTWDTYKWGMVNEFTKYTGTDKTVLDPEDDAAAANWGGKWRMPTIDEIKELLDNTTHEWTTQNDVDGRKFTAKNGSGNSIFLPAAGYRYDSSLLSVGFGGYYWSSSLDTSASTRVYRLYFDSSTEQSVYFRNNGYSVRPVISKTDVTNGIEMMENQANFENRWYTLDGKKLNGEPTRKGVYIRNGRKVVK